MNKAFEKIIGGIEKLKSNKGFGGTIQTMYADAMLDKAKKIVQEVAEEYNGGWIPCNERFPEDDKYILISFENFSVPIVGRYEEDQTGGAFYIGDEDKTCLSQDLFVNAWQPLPEHFKECD